MSYIKTGTAHASQLTEDRYGNEKTRYSRYETGFIEGEYRDMSALIADETGFDGLGFDATAGSNDDKWHVVNLFENRGHYIDSVAIAGALDDEHARTLAVTQFDHLGADYGVVVGYTDNMQFDRMTDDEGWSIDAISKLLNNPSQDKHFLPIITSKELYEEATRAAFNDVQWDNLTLSSHGGSLANLYTDMIRADTFKELTQEFDLQQALIDLEAEEAEFDSIMDTVNRLPMLKERLFRAMSQASNETLSVTNVTQTKPFKRGGVVNVAFVFDLSDGQKLSIWFHNPDSTPSKLLAGDMMVSWKWLLNKRDVTAILSPINGQDVKIPTLARQMMLLASKNSKNFKRAQERKAKRDADINEAQSNIEQKKQAIEQLDKDIASLKEQIDAAMQQNKSKANIDTTENADGEPEYILEPDEMTVSTSSNVAEDEAKVELSGNELGSFDETKKGLIDLRSKAKDVFNSIAGNWINCPALEDDEGENAKVEIRKRGIKKFISHSADPRKLKLVAKIEDIIATATNATWQENIKVSNKPMASGYYHLENTIKLGEELIKLRVVVEKDVKDGLLHYDLLVPKNKSFDSLQENDNKKMPETAIPDHDSGVASGTDNIKSNYADEVNMFDSIEDDYEINIEILEVIEQGNSSKQAEDNFVDTTDKSAKEQSITSQLDPKEAPKSDVETFSPENPYALYANSDEDAMANAERWEARKVLTEKGLEKLNELAESFGFTTFIEPRHAGLGVFQAVKEVSNRRVEIEGKFKNYDGESAKESPNDFTIEWSQDGEVVDYQYTNDLPEYIEKANNWLNQDVGSLNEQNVATVNAPEDIESGEQEVSDIEQGHAMQQTETAYSQDDTDYLNSIIDGSLSTDDIDLDRLTVIGEKDEHNPLFTQALDVVLRAVDKESSDL
ncbi:defense against restriction DarA-related protein [Psychrobacter sanguinis]|uniref:defense against restriction DarA-related protein n=1 Tax=Psychrobacter sanguinis TaxID=861445 RepID=UPI001917F397|nr:PRTRC system protein E [Psychrobacter sanguinis]MCC3344504.1 PRTRC system protein E [Psychrobacter sanguinis]